MNGAKRMEQVGFVIIALILGVGLIAALVYAIVEVWQASWIAGAITTVGLLGIALFLAGTLLDEDHR